jgi:hypothetical protein
MVRMFRTSGAKVGAPEPLVALAERSSDEWAGVYVDGAETSYCILAGAWIPLAKSGACGAGESM